MRKTEITAKARRIVHERDGDCIFCLMGYEPVRLEDRGGIEVMHYIGRAQMGRGDTPQNLALGCSYHHRMMDNGPKLKEMRKIMKDYLSALYPEWNEDELVYTKWR